MKTLFLALIMVCAAGVAQASVEKDMSKMQIAPAPLFRDPVYDGAADPAVIWNYQENAWWMVYTNRRANVDGPGVGWVHGTDIGIASSVDSGKTWTYRGIMRGLEFEPGRNTFWAPEVIWNAGIYHMYMSYVPGVPSGWYGPRYILHYTSRNLWDWKFESKLALSSERVIDACVLKLPSGKWRMWYKDEAAGSHTFAADSDDLYAWNVVGPVITDRAHEGPNVFKLKDKYWMVMDAWKGLGVYSSTDAEKWTMQSDILVDPGKRADDGAMGQHADVLVQGDDAFIFYFTHPQLNDNIPETVPGVTPYAKRRTSIQVAKLEVVGDKLVCDRDKPFDFRLQALKYEAPIKQDKPTIFAPDQGFGNR